MTDGSPEASAEPSAVKAMLLSSSRTCKSIFPASANWPAAIAKA
jgi:hypothetical protein